MNRIAGMDVWRGLLLSAGVFVHSAQSVDLVACRMFAEASHLFRMEAFFTIAGFFGALSLAKVRARDWMLRRVVMLGVPLLVGIALIVPFTHHLLAAFAHRPDLEDWYVAAWPPGDWHIHLWFLLSLLLYTPLTLLLDRSNLPAAAEALVARHCSLVVGVFWAVAALSSMAVVAVLTKHAGSMAPIIRHSQYYFAFYLLGFCLQRSELLMARMLALPRWTYAVAACLLVFTLAATGVAGGGRVAVWAHYLSRPIIGLAATSLIFRSALALRQCRPWQARLSAASYTIYLLHVPVLVLALMIVSAWHPQAYLALLVVPIAVIALLFLFHEAVVRKSATARFLLNGKLSDLALARLARRH